MIGPGVQLGLAWSALLLALAFRVRPRPSRLVQLHASAFVHRPTTASESATKTSAKRFIREWVALVIVGVLGRFVSPVTSRLKRWLSADDIRLRRFGGALIAGIPLLLVRPSFAPVGGALAWWAPTLERKRASRRREQAVVRDLPEIVDLVVLAIAAGANITQAVTVVSRRSTGPLGSELARVISDVQSGLRLADALDALPARAGEGVRGLSTALASSERYGASLSGGLDRFAVDVRSARRRRAEEHARRVPVKLLFPLICCTLPAFALLTIAPLIASGLRALRL